MNLYKSRNFNEQINDIVYLIQFSHMMDGQSRKIQQIRQQQSYIIKSRVASPIKLVRRSSQQNLSQVQLPPLFKQQEIPDYDESILERVRKLEMENDHLKKLIKPKKRKRQHKKNDNQVSNQKDSQLNSKLNLPTHKDLVNMEQQLKQLILTKLRLIVQICLRNRRNAIRFIKIIKELLKEKIQLFIKQFPKIQSNFEQQIKEKMNDKLKGILGSVGNKKFFEDKSKFFNETKRRVAETVDCLRSVYKILFSIDGDIYNESLFEFIQKIASDNITVPPFYLFKFELNRLTFTTLGGLRLKKAQSQLMIFTSLWIRIYIPIIFDFKLPNQFPQFDKNIHTIGSFIYNTLMDYLRSSHIQVRDNLKNVPYDYQPSLRSRNVIKFYRFQENENDKEKLINLQIKDEPLLYPIQDRDEFNSLYEERIFIQSLYQQYEGWAEQVYQLLIKYMLNQKQNQKQSWYQKSNKLYQMNNLIQPSLIKQQYTSTISMIYNLKEDIKQTKNCKFNYNLDLDIYEDVDSNQ